MVDVGPGSRGMASASYPPLATSARSADGRLDQGLLSDHVAKATHDRSRTMGGSALWPGHLHRSDLKLLRKLEGVIDLDLRHLTVLSSSRPGSN